MIIKGISVYPGLDNTLEENLNLIEKAGTLGYRKLFVSLHIPETNKEILEKEIQKIIQLATKCKMEVIADISAETKKLPGITSFRLDEGFSPKEVGILLAEDGKRKIVLNASTVTDKFLQELGKAKVDFRRITALHNFYPHRETGLDEAFFLQQNTLLAQYGILTGAFIVSQQGPRGPLYEGLPSLEKTRKMAPDLAARYLAVLGVAEIIIGDSMPAEEELKDVAAVQDGIVVLGLTDITGNPVLRDFLKGTFTIRPEKGKELLRTVESRGVLKGQIIKPTVMQMRPAGTVTIDNNLFGRYQGELTITKEHLPPEFRTTVVGHLPEEEVFLLKHLQPGTKFHFKSRTFGF